MAPPFDHRRLVFSVNPQLIAKLGYDSQKFLPVTLIGRAPIFLAVHSSVPAETMKEFIAYVKANPGKLNYGSSGFGSAHHLSMEAIDAGAQIEV